MGSDSDNKPLPLLDAWLEAQEALYVVCALTRARGVVAEFAKIIGRERTHAYRILRRHGLNPDEYRGDNARKTGRTSTG